MSIGHKLHTMGTSHDRYMASALSAVAKADFHKREAVRYQKGTSVDYAAAAKRHAASGYECLRVAIQKVVDCGCDRVLWPVRVQKAISDPGSQP